MVAENDDEKTVVLLKHGNYRYLLNDIVHLLRLDT